jgi:NADH dehydrogenase FAD-containing subunit
LFGQEIKVSIVSHKDHVLVGQPKTAIVEVMNKLKKHNIEVIKNERVARIEHDGVVFESGRKAACNVAVWATGAEAQPVTLRSDLAINNGYFNVNDFLQSTSHSNVFAGGDCITIESFADEKPTFPPKAGVYAVREGPVIAQNLCNMIEGKPLVKYVPQRSFLSLLMTGDGECISNKYGIAFSGRWVWNMKDWIDRGFMKLFDPHYLFEDYAKKGCATRLENNELFDDEDKDLQALLKPIKARVATMDPVTAGRLLSCDEHEEEFHERFQILMRMHTDEAFEKAVVQNFKPKYITQNW